MQEKRSGLNKRALLGVVIATVLIALTVAVSAYMGDTQYYIASVMIIFWACLPFFMGFEGRNPQASELVTIAVLTAIAVAARTLFAWLPFLSPTMGVIFICGMGMGPGSGFLIGALTAVTSDFLFFGLGPWAPWQMFACGVIGFLGGVLANIGFINKDTRLKSAICGALIDFIIVGIILNTCTLFLTMHIPTNASILAVYISGIPVDGSRAVFSFFAILFLAKPMLEKLERVKKKYGMMEAEDHEL